MVDLLLKKINRSGSVLLNITKENCTYAWVLSLSSYLKYICLLLLSAKLSFAILVQYGIRINESDDKECIFPAGINLIL